MARTLTDEDVDAIANQLLEMLEDCGFIPSRRLDKSSSTQDEPTIEIYALLDPGTDAIRYIGQSVSAGERFGQHLYDALNYNQWWIPPSSKQRWIRELHAAGKKPGLRVLEEVPKSKANAAELRWIRWALKRGHDLTNIALVGC